MDILATSFVRQIFQSFMDETVSRAERFSTGLSLLVYDVVTESGAEYVVRIAPPDRKSELQDGLFWQKKLEKLMIPLPKIYRVGQIEGCIFAIYERLPGDDLEAVYHSLSSNIKESIAHSVASIQQKVYMLEKPQERDFPSWSESVRIVFRRSENGMLQHGFCDNRYIEIVRDQLHKHESYLSSVNPVAFLYDTNIRNVIVHNEKVSGIVDVDEVSFGDPLLTVGRGKTLLLSMRQDTDYIRYWCEYLDLSEFQRMIVDLYALLYCLRFMGTLGQKLNGNYSSQTDPKNAELLEAVADDLLGRLD